MKTAATYLLQLVLVHGKTAVLVERIINKIINEKINIDELLVVTFTRAAASEMKERIIKRLYDEIEKNSELQKQINSIGKASITTIDAFSLKIVKDNFFKANLDPNFKIGDNAEIELIKLETIEEMFEEYYEKEDANFDYLVNSYARLKDDESLKSLLLRIYKNINSNPYPFEWLRANIEKFNISKYKTIEEMPQIEYLLKYIKTEIKSGIEELSLLKDELSRDSMYENYYYTLEDDVSNLMGLFNKSNSYEDLYNAINNFNLTRLKSVKDADEGIKNLIKEKRENIKKSIITEIKEKVFIFSKEEVIEDMNYIYNNLNIIYKYLFEFSERFYNNKIAKNTLDFSDIEHLALKILNENEDVRNYYKNQYKEIMIDEYQDSNLLQEFILNSISNRNIFMVGDVKQSIYRFRSAKPELFLNKYENYIGVEDNDKNNKKDEVILLFENFRSNKNIINQVNFVFENIMSKELGEIDYNEKEFLKYGATYYENDGEKAELYLIDTKADQDTNEELIVDSNIELEARFIAKKIKSIVGVLDVYDKKLEKYRKATYKDIVILSRKMFSIVNIYVDELSNFGIPVYADVSGGYFENTEVQIILSLLKIIDNPYQDIPLFAVLKSQIGGFSIDELTKIRLLDRKICFYDALLKYLSVEDELSKKISNFLDKLYKYREESKYLGLSTLLWKIYNETGYYYYISLFPDGYKRQMNLKLLIERANKFENSNFKGLFNFLNYIDNISSSSVDIGDSKVISENEDVVRIMSIHKSKGLEFPIVFLANTSSKFNISDFNENIILDSDLGFGEDVIDFETKIKYSTFSKFVVKQKAIKATKSEEMRILYVALTRAREKLIVTGLCKNANDYYIKNGEPISRFKINKVNNFLDWISMSVISKTNLWKTIIVPYEEAALLDSEKDVDNKKDFLKSLIQKNDKSDIIDSQMNYIYINELATKIPVKISISEIKRMQSKEEEFKNINIIKTPSFLSDDISDGAMFGTNMHNALQKLNFKDDDFKFISSQITSDDKLQKLIYNKLTDFSKSNLYLEISKAKKIYKEQAFNLNILAKEVYNDIDCEDTIMVQGIIDLYFITENNDIILVDYKTDSVKSKEELILRYKIQLDFYKRALEEITGLCVSKTIIYSLKLNEEILL